VLEARDRLGGRIWTTTFAGGSAVDLGASWIHGVGPGITDAEDEQGEWKGQENPVYTLAKAHKIKTWRTWAEGEEGTKVDVFMPDGSRQLPPKFWKQVDAVEDFVDEEKTWKAKVHESFGDYLFRTLWQGQPNAGDAKVLQDFAMNYNYCLANGADPYEISAKYID